ncbi:MAG: PaaI family thioesterase [Bacillota bacterium]|nr:PaaI family thioesterase [Bacillota bacterium]
MTEDEKLERLKNARNEDKGFARYINVETIALDEGMAQGKIEMRPEFNNAQLIVHGGLLFALADDVGGTAARTYGHNVVTVNANIEYLNPGIGVETLYAKATVLSKGRKILRFKVEVEDQMKNLLCIATMTYAVKSQVSHMHE